MPPADTTKAKPVYSTEPSSDGFAVHRDGMLLKTPAGNSFALPTKTLAEHVADEWRGQGDKIKPETMPLTQLAATAIDIVSKKGDEIVTSVSNYAGSDLLCHRAEEPPELASQQAAMWQRWLDWAGQRYGAPLNVGQGVMPVAQPAASLAALRDVVAGYDHYHLAGLQQIVGITGSLILGLALEQQIATVDEIFESAELDALFQMKKWGEDPVTIERHKGLRKDIEDCSKWFRLLRA